MSAQISIPATMQEGSLLPTSPMFIVWFFDDGILEPSQIKGTILPQGALFYQWMSYSPSSKISLVLYDISIQSLLIPTPISSILTSFISRPQNITLMPRILQGRFLLAVIKGFIPSTLCHISFALVTKKRWDFLWNCRSFMHLYFIHAFCTVKDYLKS